MFVVVNILVKMQHQRRRRARRDTSAAPSKTHSNSVPNYVRRLAPSNTLTEQQIVAIEARAEQLLEEIGVDMDGNVDLCERFEAAGARVENGRVHFPAGLGRELCATAPSEFVMTARNPARSVTFGGNNLVFGPGDSIPFVTDLDNGRRYGTVEDHANLSKLVQLSPGLHHNGQAVCEISDVAVNKRHLDLSFHQLPLTDKPMMGATLSPDAARDSLDMLRIVFGDDTVEASHVMLAGTNVQSPLAFEARTLDVLRVYSEANQPSLITPFVIAGAMSPVTMAAVLAQVHAEVQAGVAVTQLYRPGCPAVYSSFVTTMDLRTGAPTYGTPESTLANAAIPQLARRLGLPVRAGGHITASKVLDGQAMQESADACTAAVMAGANYVLQAAGWLEGGLTIGFEKFVVDAQRCEAMGRLVEGIAFDDNAFAADAYREVAEAGGTTFLGAAHTYANMRTANIDAGLADTASFEQWSEEGSLTVAERANAKWKQMLADYEPPPLDNSIHAALVDFVTDKKGAAADAWY